MNDVFSDIQVIKLGVTQSSVDISSRSIQIPEKIQIPIDKDPVKTTNNNHTSLFFSFLWRKYFSSKSGFFLY